RVGRPCRLAQGRPEPFERRGILVVAVDVAEGRHEPAERDWIVDAAAVGLDAVPGTFAKRLDAPARGGHPDYRHVEPPPLGHGVKRGEDLLVGEVTGGPEEHEGVGPIRHISSPPSLDAPRTPGAWPTGPCRRTTP